MEFTRKKRVKEARDAEDIRRRMLNWPDCYYREREPQVRKALLDEADAEGLTKEENRIRRKLYERRYPSKGPTKDSFLKAWLDVRFLKERDSGLFKGPNPKKLMKVLDEIGFDELGEDRVYRGILYQEVYHLGLLYASLCQEDKGYSSIIFGIGTLSEDKLAGKIGAEFRDIAIEIPKKFNLEDSKYSLWTDALTDAYCDMFPDFERSFRSEE